MTTESDRFAVVIQTIQERRDALFRQPFKTSEELDRIRGLDRVLRDAAYTLRLMVNSERQQAHIGPFTGSGPHSPHPRLRYTAETEENTRNTRSI